MFVDYSIRRVVMAGARKQIDLAKRTKIPEQEDEADLSPTKAPKVGPVAGPAGAGVTAAELQAMLSQQTAQLIQTQEATVASAVAKFEAVVQERVGAAETRVTAVESRLETLEKKLNQALGAPGSSLQGAGGPTICQGANAPWCTEGGRGTLEEQTCWRNLKQQPRASGWRSFLTTLPSPLAPAGAWLSPPSGRDLARPSPT